MDAHADQTDEAMATQATYIDPDTIDDATRAKLRALFDAGTVPGPAAPARAPAMEGLLAAEVTDTHHPDSPGRVRVRWHSAQGEAVECWLQCLHGHRPRRGDRVLVEQPVNWSEPLVTGILSASAAGAEAGITEAPGMHGATGAAETHASQTVKLAPDECVQIDDAHGKPLVQILASSAGPVVRLMSSNVNLEAAGKLSLRAQALELEAGRGGVDIRTEADTVVRSRYIRLN
ncbi:hypothetical protein M3A49_35980 [Paraburkholderia sp. CNPSo 3076]|uniref:hypothetical protein n=1 Tax=Paraburkholderia sp. CNPSo 3076 TaxID=2940936 RepID=UPI002255ED5D|nr:hypothetical protein [Paraburkholderia sp. CNPSo 3076]MCX5544797.1 hypothetical protein [Paraburkholderia sp. CNPSo 3076]